MVKHEDHEIDCVRVDLTSALAESIGHNNAITASILNFHLTQREALLSAAIPEQGASGPHSFLRLPNDHDALFLAQHERQKRDESFDTLLVIGTGGSSLGLRAIDDALRYNLPEQPPALRIIDNTDPATIRRAVQGVDLRRTLVLAISKSGFSSDVLLPFEVVLKMLEAANCSASEQALVLTADSSSPLAAMSRERGVPLLPLSPDVGGRFSVLSLVGLMPAALLGYDCHQLLRGAAAMRDRLLAQANTTNEAKLLAALHVLTHDKRNKAISVMLAYDSRLRGFGDWYAQLWCESLGKPNGDEKPCGQMVVPAIGTTAEHSLAQLLLEGPNISLITMIKVLSHLDSHEDSESDLSSFELEGLLHDHYESMEKSFFEAERPVVHIQIPELNAFTLGALFMLYEVTTIYAATLLGVDPYSQPAVEGLKRTCSSVLST